MASPPPAIKPIDPYLIRGIKSAPGIVWRYMSGIVKHKPFWIGAASGMVLSKLIRR